MIVHFEIRFFFFSIHGLGLGNDQHDLGQRQHHIACHIITFMIQDISPDLCFPLAHYAPDRIIADLLYPFNMGHNYDVRNGFKTACIVCNM